MQACVTEIRALLVQFETSGLKDMYLRTGGWTGFMAQPGGGANPMQLAAPAPAAEAAVTTAITAPHLGLFEPACASGDAIAAGALIARIDVLGRKTEVVSASGGRIAAVHFAANDLVEYGETLVEIVAG